MRREGRELCLTWWLADDCANDCLIESPLPVPRLRQHVSDKWYHTSGSDGGLGLHAHMDAGMNIATGYALRDLVQKEHEGETFVQYLTEYATLWHPTLPPYRIRPSHPALMMAGTTLLSAFLSAVIVGSFNAMWLVGECPHRSMPLPALLAHPARPWPPSILPSLTLPSLKDRV